MAEASKTGFDRIDPARSVLSDNNFTEESKFGELDRSAPVSASNGYVTLDVANLSLLAASSDSASGDIDFAADSRVPLTKTLSRKGSQRGGVRKVPVSAAAAAAGGGEKLAFLVHVASEGEEGTLRVATTPTAAGSVGSRCRRLAFRRPSPWLDPRRVLVFFATLSSMGTLILLYFTLFMGNIPSGDDNAR